MIIGNGLIANAFKPYFEKEPNFIIYASGVSNSQGHCKKAFLREREMLINALSAEKFLIYFSTCSIDDPELQDSLYVNHKLAMEELVCQSRDYMIFRLPQVVGKTPNRDTLTNYLFDKIVSGGRFQVWQNAMRNLIDIEDVALIVAELIRNAKICRTVINVACPYCISVVDLVAIFESVVGKKANYEVVDAGGTYAIDTSIVAEAALELGVDFYDSYISRLIRKYYGK